jgi:hypothetical protein
VQHPLASTCIYIWRPARKLDTCTCEDKRFAHVVCVSECLHSYIEYVSGFDAKQITGDGSVKACAEAPGSGFVVLAMGI